MGLILFLGVFFLLWLLLGGFSIMMGMNRGGGSVSQGNSEGEV